MLIVVWLECQPPFFRQTDLLIRELRLFLLNHDLLVAATSAGRIGEQLSVAGLVEGDEPEGGLVDGAADGKQAMILQDDGLAIAQRPGDAPTLLAVQHHAAEVVVYGVRAPKAQRVLRHHVELAAEHAPRLAVHAVRVARRVHVRPRLVDLRVDGEGGRVDGLVANHHFAVFVDED